MEYLLLGKVIDAFGLDGTLKIISSTFYGAKRYQKGNKVYLTSPNGEKEEYEVISYRNNKNIDFVKLVGINSKEEALEKRGYSVEVIKDNSLLEKDEYFFSDLENCDVYFNESRLGKVKKVEEFPSVITLRVSRNNNKDFFVPFINDFIKKVDIENKRIDINVIEGML